MNLSKIYDFIVSQSNPNDPKILLKDLLMLSNFIYSKTGSAAVQYGNGTHPKHRLTKYHDFFVNNIGKNDSVIDLGSGRGDVTYDVANKTENRVVGIEINPSNLSYAQKTYQRSNLYFTQGDICHNVPNNHFDVVILSNILEHLRNRSVLLKSIVQKTSPQKILIRVPYFERDWTVAMKKELGVAYFLDDTHQIEYTHEEFYREMEGSDLEVASAVFKWGEIWAICHPKKI